MKFSSACRRHVLPAVILISHATACAVGSSGATGDDDAGATAPSDAAIQNDDATSGAYDAGHAFDAAVASDAGSAPSAHDASTVDASPPPHLDASSPPDASPSLDASPPPPVSDAGSCSPVINELMTGVVANAAYEFVEIYNPCPTSIDLTSWRLAYRAGTNTSPVDASFDVPLYTWSSGSVIASGAFLLYAGNGYPGTVDGALASGLKDGSGAVALRAPNGAIAHSLGYGSANASNAFVETRPAPANDVVGAPGSSIRLLPDGHATGDNGGDFGVTSTPTPRAPNR